MFKIGPKTRMDAPSLVKEASADDPIYTRGFAVGETRSRPSSSDTAATTSPESRKESPSSRPDLSPFEVEARKSLEESLHRLYEQHTGQPWREPNPSSESTTPESPEKTSPGTSTEQE